MNEQINKNLLCFALVSFIPFRFLLITMYIVGKANTKF